MQKKILTSAILLSIGGFASSANADLASGTLGLDIQGNLNPVCVVGGTYPACTYGAFDTADAGSYFTMDGNPAGAIDGNGGLLLLDGTVQSYDTSDVTLGSSYAPGDGRSPFMQDWDFFNSVGTNGHEGLLVSAGDTAIDMSTWFVTWNEVPVIAMGGDTANFPEDTGIAALVCTGGAVAACELGDTFTLDYAAHVPTGDPSGFGGTPYVLHLQGTVNAVPVPAAVWLFGSGLLGLVGVARRRKAA